MEMGSIKKISKGICLLLIFVFLSYIILNISLNILLSKKSVTKGLKEISFTEVVYSETFDGNIKVESFRSNLKKIYKVVSIFGIKEEEFNNILNDSVRSDTTSIMVTNVVYTIKTGEPVLLISKEEFDVIIDDFVNNLLDRLNLNSVERKFIGDKVSSLGHGLIKYVPETDVVINKISKDKYNTIRFLINKNILILCSIFTLLCILGLYVCNNRLYTLFKDFSRVLYSESVIITLFIIVLYILASTKYNFMYGIISIFTNTLFNFLWFCLIGGTISILIHSIIDKKKKLEN